MTEPKDPRDPKESPTPAESPPPPADPAEYDTERNAIARARGLSAPYIAGGRDPDPEAGRQEERRYLRLLVAMVVVIVLAGFVLGLIATVLTGAAS